MEYPLSYRRFLDQGNQLFTDSRQIIPSAVFLALSGKNFDGNEFALEALDKGAAYAIVDRIVENDSRLILVENTLRELQQIAALHRKINKAKIIAITGTNGKTTTKELAYSIFRNSYHCIATEGNLNNHIGVPLTLLRISEKTEYAIIEMGANQPGDIMELCKIANPEIGLISSIGKAHLEGFGNIQGVIKTKKELFDYLESKGGIRLYNMCSEYLKEMYSPGPTTICYGNKWQKVDYFSELLHSFPDIEMNYSNGKEEIILHSGLFGEYNYQNILSAATLASVCEISMQQIRDGVANYVPSNMRSQIILKDDNTIILDAYNANPSSMKEVLEIFDEMDFKTKWIILGEMAELGIHKESEHQILVDLIRSKNFDKNILIGKTYEKYRDVSGIQHFNDVSDCKAWLKNNWPGNTAILIKGSRSSALEKLIH